MKNKMQHIFFIIIILLCCKNVEAKGIEKVWENVYDSSDWSHIDYFDYTKDYTKYSEHLRGFKELDDSYIIVLKNGSDPEDEIIKISKTGELIKSIKFDALNINENFKSSNFKIEDDHIIIARIISENNYYYLKLEKYDFNFHLLKEDKHNLGKSLGVVIRIFINDDSIILFSLAGDFKVSYRKFNYEFKEMYNKTNFYTGITIPRLYSIYNESAIGLGDNSKSYVFDSKKEKMIEGEMDYQAFFEQYSDDEYKFYGNGKDIGNNFYYHKINDEYNIYNMNDKLVTKSSTKFLYDIHGKLAISKDDYVNSSFDIYDTQGNLEMTCNMFIKTKDGFLVLKKESTNNVVNKLKVEKYEIKYNISINDSQNGIVKTESKIHSVNDLVKLEILPESGYVLSKVKITDQYGNEIEYDKEKLIFQMPENDVDIEVFFEKKQGTITNPETGTKIIFVEMSIIGLIFVLFVFSTNKYNKIKKI